MFLSSILFLTTVWQWSILQAGFGVAPGPLLVAALAPFVGRLATAIGQRPLLLVGGILYAIGGLWRLLMLGPESNYVVEYLPSMLFSGLGISLCLPQLSSVVGQALPPNRYGVGGAVSQAFRQFGGTFGVALTIGLLGRAGRDRRRRRSLRPGVVGDHARRHLGHPARPSRFAPARRWSPLAAASRAAPSTPTAGSRA
jgi:MFS family permease